MKNPSTKSRSVKQIPPAAKYPKPDEYGNETGSCCEHAYADGFNECRRLCAMAIDIPPPLSAAELTAALASSPQSATRQPEGRAVACDCCFDTGWIAYQSGQTAESFEQGEAPCPYCNAAGRRNHAHPAAEPETVTPLQQSSEATTSYEVSGEDAKDAARYRWLRRKVWANGVLSGYEFQFPTFRDLPAPATVMRGSVAQHLDNAIDAAITPKTGEGEAK